MAAGRGLARSAMTSMISSTPAAISARLSRAARTRFASLICLPFLLSVHPGRRGELGDQVSDRDGYLSNGQAGQLADTAADVLTDRAGDLRHRRRPAHAD